MLIFGEPLARQLTSDTLLLGTLDDGGAAGGKLQAHPDVVNEASDLLRTRSAGRFAHEQLAQFLLLTPVNDAALGLGAAGCQLGNDAAVAARNETDGLGL